MRTTGRLLALAAAVTTLTPRAVALANPPDSRGVLVAADAVTPDRLKEWKDGGFDTVALVLGRGASPSAVRGAVDRIRQAGLGAHYWLEIARDESIASAHPEWMASLQGHGEWRRLFPKAPEPKDNEVVKTWPWVPIVYREAFDAQLARVSRLLGGVPAPDGIFLNDLQAAPSACGCGNTICRWTPDYGPIETATRLPYDAAAKFVAAVSARSPKARVVPVWTPECEENEGTPAGHCGGLACYHGKCWKEMTPQLTPLMKGSDAVGVLVLTKEFGHDASNASWLKQALKTMVDKPPLHGGHGVEAQRMIAVVQGWDTSPEDLGASLAACREFGVRGTLVALVRVDQSWEPKIIRATPKPKAGSGRR